MAPVQAAARRRAVEPAGGNAADTQGVLLAGANPQPGLAILGSPLPRDALAAYAQAQSLSTAAAQRQPVSRVEQLMSRQLITVPLAATLAEGLALLVRHRVGQAPVVNAGGRLVGLLLRADLLPMPEQLDDPAAWASWFERPVAQAMWSPVPAVRFDAPIREVAQALLDLRLPGLPVMDGAAELAGFLSRSDILRALTREPPLELWG